MSSKEAINKMVFDKGLMDNLKNMFDLNQYEVGVWVHLLSRGVSTAGELSDLSNVPRSRAYDVLESLEKKGFVVIKIGKPIQYIAVPPAEVVNRFKKRLTIEAETRIKRLDNLSGSELLTSITELYDKGIKTYSPTELSGAFRGSQNIYDQMESMIRDAQSSVKIVTTEDGLINKLHALRSIIKKAYERGVKVQINAPLSDKNKDVVDSLSDFAEFKDDKDISARYCIVDQKQALLMLLNEDKVHPNYDVGVWLNSESIGRLLGKD
ncbi:MAG: helix-turn-helix domain-containing protein [Candidatus Nanoarchaeia archaeon]|jgi:sugar-specific transcriptional regulator TrmB